MADGTEEADAGGAGPGPVHRRRFIEPGEMEGYRWTPPARGYLVFPTIVVPTFCAWLAAKVHRESGELGEMMVFVPVLIAGIALIWLSTVPRWRVTTAGKDLSLLDRAGRTTRLPLSCILSAERNSERAARPGYTFRFAAGMAPCGLFLTMTPAATRLVGQLPCNRRENGPLGPDDAFPQVSDAALCRARLEAEGADAGLSLTHNEPPI